MFTGIIEETGTIRSVRSFAAGATLSIESQQIASQVKPGDSIAVNGVCLTVVNNNSRGFASDLSAETLRRSSFGQARAGMIVNLERALAIGDRLGGHIVQGHVDGVGKLISSVTSGEGFEMEFSLPAELEPYVVVKGSVAVDGISLTVAAFKPHSFTVAVVPHTHRVTNFRHLKEGDTVNLEADILAKYVERLLNSTRHGIQAAATKLTVEMLREQGY